MPDVISCNAATGACKAGSQWEAVLCLLGHMAFLRIIPNIITCSASISACERVGQWQLALSLLGCHSQIVP
eukprot:CAMPEP_0171124224 /NCGR_PEP_ID=MMETSP0766_2-20121228/108774_1 /TAXON_ID=439317 /ORGANISM="Gambierdiscus australes, Strain CAWD 149" /LENGTH=70 /DNA_ID=CAMNT_0011587135 /DNA_START=91 /DNA_END=300 /DNA_ORIENTATION=-